jgi:hypothetical protein
MRPAAKTAAPDVAIAFLHTAAAHPPLFDGLVQSIAPGTATRHVVREELLERARGEGIASPAVARAVAEAARSAGQGAAVLVCTCSTIGGLAEDAFSGVAPGACRALRIDRPMAERAVALADRLAVVAALASTVEPTRALLREAAAAADRSVEIETVLCEEAWAHFERGDRQGYLDRIAAAAQRAGALAGVVVLAQVSMAEAAERFDGRTPFRVLTSPRLGVEAAVAALARAAAAPPGGR